MLNILLPAPMAWRGFYLSSPLRLLSSSPFSTFLDLRVLISS
jgi:hypothetical protein